MNAAAQLARIAAVRPPAPPPPTYRVEIYQLAREWDYWTWSCRVGVVEKESEKWQVRERKPAPHDELTCDVHGPGACPA